MNTDQELPIHSPSSVSMPLKRVHSHAPSKQSSDASRLNALKRLVERHEISKLMALKLRKLEVPSHHTNTAITQKHHQQLNNSQPHKHAYDIVVICDDSGSMNTKSTAGLNVSNPFAPMPTRWDELKETVAIVTYIACILDDDGIDIYFLNRAALSHVTSTEQLEQAFSDSPRGYTPTARVLRQVLNDRRHKKESDGAKKLLVLIATDDSGDDDKDGLKDVLTREGPNKVPVVFLTCTDDDEEIGYLTLSFLRRQVKAVQGPQFPFSRGDWVCKMLLGPVDPEMDMLDEVPLARPLAREG
ncbi:hypothetical protein BJ741DRAFT_580718 [Chytriomyces cf. hyalinus JEL632]|nr:hypothetical protein BJ741DRAFT_580718 [Chytriomyces cf. hyalinus JEL632]